APANKRSKTDRTVRADMGRGRHPQSPASVDHLLLHRSQYEVNSGTDGRLDVRLRCVERFLSTDPNFGAEIDHHGRDVFDSDLNSDEESSVGNQLQHDAGAAGT